MARFIKNRQKAFGQAPGELVFIGRQKMDEVKLTVMDYDREKLIEDQVADVNAIKPYLSAPNVSWINLYGLHDEKIINRLGEYLHLHPLLLEDLMNTDQRPKYEGEEEYDAFILKMLQYDEEKERIQAEQITLILGHNYVCTLQERKGDVFQAVRYRIRNSKGRIRQRGNDYLAYVLVDAIVDNYLKVIEIVGDKIELLEEKIFSDTSNGTAQLLYSYKMELSFLRKAIRPVKEILLMLLKAENHFFAEETARYLRDLNDLVNQANEAIELYNSIITDQLNIYNTNVNNKMNQIMKVLTLFASVFIPLTFIAGVYGMNFDYIPELKYKYAYPLFWAVIISVVIAFLWYFKRKRWL